MPVRIVFADDSVAVRSLMQQALGDDTGLKIVGAAKDGKEALSLVRSKHPDILILDVEMPVLDGIDAVRRLRTFERKLPVLMFSSLTEKGCEATLDAMEAGANDYLQKPAGAQSVEHAIEYIRRELVPKIKSLAMAAKEPPVRLVAQQPKANPRPSLSRTTPSTTPTPKVTSKAAPVPPRVPPRASTADSAAAAPGNATPSPPRIPSARPCGIIVIGSSTGGPNALSQVVKGLSPGIQAPVLIVQHMPPTFTKMLAERLNAVTDLTVTEAREGDVMSPGKVVIAPGDQHMEIETSGPIPRVRLHTGPEENSCRPAVDVLFRSAAKKFRGRILGTILTGMGQDGKEGCRNLREVDSHIIAQDQQSSVIWGMPRAVAEAGLADEILPLTEIADAINQHVKVRQPILSSG